MCLGVPGKILSINNDGDIATVDFWGMRRQVRLDIVDEPVKVGDKFDVFIPVGRTFDPDTGKDWEGTGVAPDVAVPARDALVEALVRSGVSRTEAERIDATVKPTGSMERRTPRRIATAD